jgi:uncharacterized membrane protein YgaE (UPF0421/DUF939 family)
MKIGYRTLKTAIGVMLTVIIIEMLQLDNMVVAAMLTILSIQVTKKQSVNSALKRLISSFIVILFSYFMFEWVSYHPLALGLLILFFIPFSVRFKLTEAITTSSVIMLHLYTYSDFSMATLTNLAGIICVGIGVALLMNLYMPSQKKQLRSVQEEVENCFRKIFKEFSFYLRNGESVWDGKEITEAPELIEKAKSMAFKDIENHIYRNKNDYYRYFQMREKQLTIIERMMPIVSSLHQVTEHGEILADFFTQLSKAVNSDNTAHIHLKKIEELRTQYKQMPLPKTRAEFEVRANLYHLVNEIQQYLIIKYSYTNS